MTGPRSSVHPAGPSRSRLRALGLRANKGLSQSFLDDQQVAASIVAAARLDSKQDVLEVGPGLGVLTHRLSSVARRVVAVEIDPHLAEQLSREFTGSNVSIVAGDILQVEPASFFDDEDFSVVANLPYHVTSPALRRLLSAGPPFAKRLVVMVQAEVADRIASPAGSMTALAVAIQAQSSARVVLRVPSSAFYPRPKVNSAVLLLEPLADSRRIISRAQLAAFTTLVQAGFKQPRKTLLNSLSEGLGLTRSEAADRLLGAGIDLSLRPQAIAVEDWARLFRLG